MATAWPNTVKLCRMPGDDWFMGNWALPMREYPPPRDSSKSEERRGGKERRYWRDWSSDVCSSDLAWPNTVKLCRMPGDDWFMGNWALPMREYPPPRNSR